MNQQALKHINIGLSLLAFVCLVASMYLSYQAGCTGDAKAGNFGNPVRALEIEKSSISALFSGLVLGAFSVALRSSKAFSQRIADGLAFAIFGFIGFWLLALQLETWGVKLCFNP
jgi:hypothetical protein